MINDIKRAYNSIDNEIKTKTKKLNSPEINVCVFVCIIFVSMCVCDR